jgi:DNA-directed RNA polymerase subunit beta'
VLPSTRTSTETKWRSTCPLSQAAQEEAKKLMLSARNLLKPAEGDPIVTPTQDMVLGCILHDKINKGEKGEGMAFANIAEAMIAYQQGCSSSGSSQMSI